MSQSERIAKLALSTFSNLPQKCKPRRIPDGSREWTPMSAIVLVRDRAMHEEDELVCISVATGTKCLPASALPKCRGSVLHDCHAEILALRGLNYWLLREVERCVQDESYVSETIERNIVEATDHVPLANSEDVNYSFRFCEGVSFHLFSTEAPCGDASMELLMASKAPGDAIPWPTQNPGASLSHTMASDVVSAAKQPPGRGYFSLLGAVRRKPSRGDAEATSSKSCTDKIALKQFTSLLAFPVDLFIARTKAAFLKGFVIYQDQYHKEGYTRAFGSAASINSHTDGRVRNANQFDTHILPPDFEKFEFEKQRNIANLDTLSNVNSESRMKASNISALWIHASGENMAVQEVILNGVRQGFKQFEDRRIKESTVCRRRMLELGIKIFRDLICSQENGLALAAQPYSIIKAYKSREQRRMVKREVVTSLGGWVTDSNLDDFALDL